MTGIVAGIVRIGNIPQLRSPTRNSGMSPRNRSCEPSMMLAGMDQPAARANFPSLSRLSDSE